MTSKSLYKEEEFHLEIKTAKKSGFCGGIKRAYYGMNRIAKTREQVNVFHRFGETAQALKWDTLKRIEREDPELFKEYPNLVNVSVVDNPSHLNSGDDVVLGFHGVGKSVKQQLQANEVNIEDLQCPFISRYNSEIEELASDGYNLLAFGRKENHHSLDAVSVANEYGRRSVIVEKPEDIDGIDFQVNEKWACVGSVTGNTRLWEAVVSKLNKINIPVKVVETVCTDSFKRQNEASELAEEADLVLVIDDGGGASNSVYEVCTSVNEMVYRVSSKEDIKLEWFKDISTVAIVGGILVPQWTIDEMASYISELSIE